MFVFRMFVFSYFLYVYLLNISPMLQHSDAFDRIRISAAVYSGYGVCRSFVMEGCVKYNAVCTQQIEQGTPSPHRPLSSESVLVSVTKLQVRPNRPSHYEAGDQRRKWQTYRAYENINSEGGGRERLTDELRNILETLKTWNLTFHHLNLRLRVLKGP